MGLHRGVHGQETALEESAECGGSHFSHLVKQTSQDCWIPARTRAEIHDPLTRVKVS